MFTRWRKGTVAPNVLVAGRTHVGRVRNENQDAYGHYSDEAGGGAQLFVVADGMGGHVRGREASRTAVDVVRQAFFEQPRLSVPRRLVKAMEAANERVFSSSRRNDPSDQSGTTCTALALVDARLYVAHVGDSRAYRVRRGDVDLLTNDHTLVAEMQREGILTDEEARDHPRRHTLVRAMGVQPDLVVDVHELERPEPGDVYVLCTDGLGEVDEEEIRCVVKDADIDAAADALVDMANERGGYDNVTVLLVKLTAK